MTTCVRVALAALIALVTAPSVDLRVHAWQQAAPTAVCELPKPTVLRREGTALLEMWELPASAVWFSENLPGASPYVAYRTAIDAAGANLAIAGDESRSPPSVGYERDLYRSRDGGKPQSFQYVMMWRQGAYGGNGFHTEARRRGGQAVRLAAEGGLAAM